VAGAFQSGAFQRTAFQQGGAAAVVFYSGGYPEPRRRTKEDIRQERIRLGILPPDPKPIVEVVEVVEPVRALKPIILPPLDPAAVLQAQQQAFMARLEMERTAEEQRGRLMNMRLHMARVMQQRDEEQILHLLMEM
jgi:hypothetical protein